MHFSAATIFALAAAASATLVSRQQRDLNYADLPEQCQGFQPCENFLDTAATCERSTGGRFTQDDYYLDCICSDREELRRCYNGCVARFMQGGDIREANDICQSGRGGNRGRRGSRGRQGNNDGSNWNDGNRNDRNNGGWKA